MSWEKLADTSLGETIELQGFLSQTEEGEWVLVPCRNCCSHPEKQKVLLLPENCFHGKPNTLLKIKGVLAYSEQAYKLAQVTVIQQEQKKLPTTTFAVVMIGLGIFWFLKARLIKKGSALASKRIK